MSEDNKENKIKINIEDSTSSTVQDALVNNEYNDKQDKADDYQFLDNNKHSQNNEDIISNQFDEAFKRASPVIQDYILGDKLEENVRLICKIEKLDEDKAKIVVENIAVSILVGLLPIDEAKNTMIDSFRSSGILLEPFTAGMILKNIDAYILSDIRKQILEDKIGNNKEIRHLTLKEKTEEKEKEELRKILLERTGNVTGKGEVLVQYKNREIPKKNLESTDNPKKYETNRESLLAKINLQNVSDTEKVKDRMIQIKKEEEERLSRLKARVEGDAKERLGRSQSTEVEIAPEEKKEEELAPSEEIRAENISKEFARSIEEKLNSNEDEKVNLDILRKQRGEEEAKNKNMSSAYSEYINSVGGESGVNVDKNFDPYRETL